jgi:hypothetical protein
MDDEGVKRMTYDYFEGGDPQRKAEAMGILIGPPMPTGYRMHVTAMHTMTAVVSTTKATSSHSSLRGAMVLSRSP